MAIAEIEEGFAQTEAAVRLIVCSIASAHDQGLLDSDDARMAAEAMARDLIVRAARLHLVGEEATGAAEDAMKVIRVAIG